MTAALHLAAGFVVGGVLGYVLKCAVMAVEEWRDRRQNRITELLVGLLPAPATVPAPPGRYSAADILGYRDMGGRWVPPSCPATRGAASSAEALAAWDNR